MTDNNDIEDQEHKLEADTSLYLAEAIFPSDVLPAYAGISTKAEAKHYAAVEATTLLGEAVIDIIKELKDLQEAHRKTRSGYSKSTLDSTKKRNWDKYVKDAKNLKMKVDKKILEHYRIHTIQQLTHGVSVKGRGRQEATGIQTSHRTGTSPPIHRRSKWERLTGGNKEPSIGERPNVK